MTGWPLDAVTVDSDGGSVGRLRLSRAGQAVAEIDEPWAEGTRTRIRAGLFGHIMTGANR